MVRAPANIAVACALVSLLADAAAQVEDCAPLVSRAAELSAMRDRDAAGGVEAARAALDTIAGTECVVALAETHAALADNLNVAGRRTEALGHYREAKGLLVPLGDSENLASVLRREGITHAESGDYPASVEVTLESMRVSEAIGDRAEAAMVAGNLGTIYSRLTDFERAREFFERARTGFEETGNEISAAGVGINLGSMLMRYADQLERDGASDQARELREQARTHSLWALERFDAIGHPRGIAMAASNAGIAASQLGDHDEALALHERALVLREQVGDASGIAFTTLYIATANIALGEFDAAEEALRTAERYAQTGDLTLQRGVAEKWVEFEEARGRDAAALERLREANRLTERIATADRDARVAEVQARYDSEQQVRRIEALEHAAELAEAEHTRQRLYTWSVAVIATLLLALILTLYARYRLKVRSQLALEQAARTDELTGLPNRRDIRERIAYEINRTRRTSRPFSLGVIDLDRFKAVNDNFGHATGDLALIAIADRLRAKLRRQDSLARWGGDELLLLMPETDEAGALELGGKLVDGFRHHALTVDGHEIKMTITIGMAQYWPAMSIDDCLQCADDALYEGKRAGRDHARARRP